MDVYKDRVRLPKGVYSRIAVRNGPLRLGQQIITKVKSGVWNGETDWLAVSSVCVWTLWSCVIGG